ncbi:hypothetical protein GGR21_002787 [Dysgonomonas hofstadii]|uniref:DUF5117 domain-containing protein n=1 Tax=Dysgonomonas hofstadii TaxID=637886 RepID=A0A840CT76_9BACT|nr:hypothetical protein [Dysgonomonas hofstadii]MBB4036874.1 hypothetical protein [Dysgonomonas hofstadii]
MKRISILFLPFFIMCNTMADKVPFTEERILNELDLAFNHHPGMYFPVADKSVIKYNFFLDLEHGYCETAGSRIHLYADSLDWAIVFEKSGYQNRGGYATIALDYIGNCVDYIIERYEEHVPVPYTSIANTKYIYLVTGEEYERIRNRQGSEMEQFELISDTITSVKVRNRVVNLKYDPVLYAEMGVAGEFENPRNLLSYGGLIRYIHDTQPDVVQATETDIRTNIPRNLSKIMTLNKFHFSSFYDKKTLPSKQELFQLIAKILVTQDSSYWKPTQEPNNHWRNWKSGNL